MSAKRPDKHPQQGIRTGAAGVSFVESRMLSEGIIPCKPSIDVGYDIVCCFGEKARRVQVKTTACEPAEGRSAKFSVKKNRAGTSRGGKYLNSPAVSYSRGDFEVFVFVDLQNGRCFVVPADEIDLDRYKISFDTTSPWMEAWWVLKDGHERQNPRP